MIQLASVKRIISFSEKVHKLLKYTLLILSSILPAKTPTSCAVETSGQTFACYRGCSTEQACLLLTLGCDWKTCDCTLRKQSAKQIQSSSSKREIKRQGKNLVSAVFVSQMQTGSQITSFSRHWAWRGSCFFFNLHPFLRRNITIRWVLGLTISRQNF